MEHLGLNEAGATATECAEKVGLSPSATSYHLRALARAGMIVDAPSRGDGRERVWQRKYVEWEVSGEGLEANAEAFAAETAMAESVLAYQNEKVRRYVAAARDEGEEWYQAARITDQTLVLTPAELTKLISQLDELTQPFQRRHRKDPPKDGRNVTLQIRAVPLLSGDVK